MDNDEQKRLRETLAGADEAILKEILREAESFLEDQFKAALAADSRAMTFAGFLAGTMSAVIAVTSLMIAAKVSVWPHIISLGLLFVCLATGLFAAVHVARPVRFYYRGNNPKFWASDIESKKTLQQALAGQITLYSEGITKNGYLLGVNQRYMWFSLRVAAWGTVVAGLIEGFILFLRVGSGG
jgi:hypothetical protein